MKKGKAGLGITLTAVLLAIMIAVGCVVNTYSEQISYWWSGTFTEPMTRAAYTADETLENGRAVSIEQASEGVVLLKNENGALPLQADERSVSLVGYGSHNPVYCGAGSVSWNTTGDRSDFYDAFTCGVFSNSNSASHTQGFFCAHSVFSRRVSTIPLHMLYMRSVSIP